MDSYSFVQYFQEQLKKIKLLLLVFAHSDFFLNSYKMPKVPVLGKLTRKKTKILKQLSVIDKIGHRVYWVCVSVNGHSIIGW